MNLSQLSRQLARRALTTNPQFRPQRAHSIFTQAQSSLRTKPQTTLQIHRRTFHSFPKRPPVPKRLQTSRATRRHVSDDALDKPDSQLSISQRLKKLSREYGWAALYIYLGLSALDFPFCFLAVKWIGTDTIGHYEHVIVGTVKEWLAWPLGGDVGAKVGEVIDKAESAVMQGHGASTPVEEGERVLETDSLIDHGYKEAEKANRGDNASKLSVARVVRGCSSS